MLPSLFLSFRISETLGAKLPRLCQYFTFKVVPEGTIMRHWVRVSNRRGTQQWQLLQIRESDDKKIGGCWRCSSEHRKPCRQVACTRSANWAHALQECNEKILINKLICLDQIFPSGKETQFTPCVPGLSWNPTRYPGFFSPLSLPSALGEDPHTNWLRSIHWFTLAHQSVLCTKVPITHTKCVFELFMYGLLHLLKSPACTFNFWPPWTKHTKVRRPLSGRQCPRCHLPSSSSFLKGRQSLKTFPAP